MSTGTRVTSTFTRRTDRTARATIAVLHPIEQPVGHQINNQAVIISTRVEAWFLDDNLVFP
jgi:hypothetical protein